MFSHKLILDLKRESDIIFPMPLELQMEQPSLTVKTN